MAVIPEKAFPAELCALRITIRFSGITLTSQKRPDCCTAHAGLAGGQLLPPAAKKRQVLAGDVG